MPINNFNTIINRAAHALPDGWEITITIGYRDVSVVLTDSVGDEHPLIHGETPDELVSDAIETAKRIQGA